MDVKPLLEAFSNVVLPSASVAFDKRLHNQVLKEEKSLHEKEVNIMNSQHLQERYIEKQIYLLSTYADVEAYCQELNENLIANNRDAERDMMDQRNKQLQTVLISGTIMLGAIIGVLFQAALPVESSKWLTDFYSLCVAISIFLLVISMIICIELVYRIYQFMYRKSESNVNHLQKQIRSTLVMDENLEKKVEMQVRGETNININGSGNDNGNIGNDNNQNYNNRNNQNGTRARSGKFVKRKFSRLHDKQIEEEFKNHESEVEQYFHERDKLNERLYQISTGPLTDGGYSGKRSFEYYWKHECEFLNRASILLFYAGTIANVIATLLFMFCYFKFQYNSVNAGYTLSAIMGCSVVIMIIVAGRMRWDPSMTPFLDDDIVGSDSKSQDRLLFSKSGDDVEANESVNNDNGLDVRQV
jgi:hypothetical protein